MAHYRDEGSVLAFAFTFFLAFFSFSASASIATGRPTRTVNGVCSYLIPKVALPAQYVDSLAAALHQLLAANPETRPEQLVSAHLSGGREGVIGSDAFMQLATHPVSS